MKFAFTVMIVLSLYSYSTAKGVGVPAFLAQLASGLSNLPGLRPPGVVPAVGVPGGAPFGQLPGGANLPSGNLPAGTSLPTGSLPGAGLPDVPFVGKKVLKPKLTSGKLAGHQDCLETYFPPCESGYLMYCYMLHLCAKMY
ncbi:hypothetical protein BsWGS_28796 [Bradybaena similaris]